MKSTMQLIAKAILCLLAPVAIGSCSSGEGDNALLRLSTDGAVLGADGGSRTIEVAVYPKGEAWEVSQATNQDWFVFSTEGNTLTITAEANLSDEERSGELQIASPKKNFPTKSLYILQEAATKAEFSTNAAESYAFDSEGGAYSFSVVTNRSWSLTTTEDWITVESDTAGGKATIITEPNTSEQSLAGVVTLTIGSGTQSQSIEIAVTQGTRAENPYYRLCGKWEISASKWYYSPNGSLNSLDYAPNASLYYLIFDIEEGVYGESLVMRNFLYPGTSLEVRYDAQSGGFVIPFGWTVLSYNVFFYVTMVSSTQFSYAALEVNVTPSSDYSILTPAMPSVSGFNYVGFGLWTYNDNGAKVALGSSARPTMFPMGDIVFRKTQL